MQPVPLSSKERNSIPEDLPEFPEFTDMPEPAPLLTKSWEDFWEYAREITQKKWKRDPSREEIIGIFESCNDMDCENGTYWSTVSEAVRRYYE